MKRKQKLYHLSLHLQNRINTAAAHIHVNKDPVGLHHIEFEIKSHYANYLSILQGRRVQRRTD